jgi:hypothetical protein
MEAIYIEPKNSKELELLKKIAELIGAKSHILSDKEKKLLAGLKMVEIAENHPKYDISDEEIMNMAKEVEEVVYGKRRK